HKYDFDLLDPTKIVPEEDVPVQLIGTLTLNRNPDNFFAETEQIAFHPGHLVPGIDFSNDPLLQGRLFSYTDTQLSRLGSPNFHEIPINRSVNTVHNNQRDGHMRQQIAKGKVSYEPNSIGGGCPYQAMMKDGGFTSHEERIDGHKVRARSQSFVDHYSQAKLFYNSQSAPEKTHLQNALIFELSKVQIPAIRERVVGQLAFINQDLAATVARKVGVSVVKLDQPNGSIPADADPATLQSAEKEPSRKRSDALSMENTAKDSIASRIIGFIMEDGVNATDVDALKSKLESRGAVVQIIAGSLAAVTADDGSVFVPKHSLTSTASVCFDALYICSGKKSADHLLNQDNKPGTLLFINEAYKHCKAICFGSGTDAILSASNVGAKTHDDPAVITSEQENANDLFIKATANHRVWELETERNNPA
ncbi:MAG: catalase, partial [Chryseobacterium sp.]